jgi:hypothetical protein
MAMILAYTSPALGHLLPISALLAELSRRGHTVHVRTLSTGVEIGQRLGFAADAIDPRIEEIEQDDWKATNPVAALKRSVAVFTRRATHEVSDLADAVTRVRPDALLVDVNCWGELHDFREPIACARRSGSNYGWGAGAKPDGVVAVTLGVATLVSGTGGGVVVVTVCSVASGATAPTTCAGSAELTSPKITPSAPMATTALAPMTAVTT